MSRKLNIDGASTESGLFAGTDGPNDPNVTAPFVVFDEDQQENIAGPFDTYGQADEHRQAILNGAEPQMDVERMMKWISAIDADDAPSPSEVAKLFVQS